jgi:UDP-hydrolysing UDP-N-acetyl-D-glucosamine 2-epimerase
MKQKIAIFTGNRAEYGMQKPIIEALKQSKKFNYLLIVSGSHLKKKFGETINHIKKDGFKISYKVKLNNKSEIDKSYTASNISKIISDLTKILKKEKPSAMIVNADRFETFAAGIASSQMSIPTIHIEGGDVTSGGTLDDNVRHALTKLSHLHFVTNKKSYQNLLSLGEEKFRIFNVGLASNDLINKKLFINKKIIKNKFKLKFRNTIIFTFHSYGPDLIKIKNEINILCQCLDYLLKNKFNIIATYPNNDHGSDIIIRKLKRFKKINKNENFNLVKSLGNEIFYSILNLNKTENVIMMGNSSSGIKESAIFKCPVINIGERQEGRYKPINVINTECNKKKILKNIKYSLQNKKYKNLLKNLKNPYFRKTSGKKIVQVLSKIKLDKNILIKKHLF